MPKIIENAKARLLAEARRQVMEQGYSATTMRSVAKGCGLAVGTAYNYFPSKEMLVASFMVEDWKACLDRMTACAESPDMRGVLLGLHEALLAFMVEHSSLFGDAAANRPYLEAFGQRHGQLRGQLARLLKTPCAAHALSPTPFLPEFVAEALLCWTVAGRSFEDLYGVIGQLFK